MISGILADENADGPRALFIAGSDGRISRAWLPEAGHDGVKDIAQVVAAVERSASEASVALHCLIFFLLILLDFFRFIVLPPNTVQSGTWDALTSGDVPCGR